MSKFWKSFGSPRRSALVERRIDRAVEAAFKADVPGTLYHYTDWKSAEGILCNQEFWATAHDCTNDQAELVTADDVIRNIALELIEASPDDAELLQMFVEGLSRFHVSKAADIYLACFSAARDDHGQWCAYAERGAGVCLGVRVLNEPGPEEAGSGVGSGIVRVDYDEGSWRTDVQEAFQNVCAVVRGIMDKRSRILALAGLYRVAGRAAIRAKQTRWAGEQEYRRVTLAHPDAEVVPRERVSRGRTVRYLPVRPRAGQRKLVLDEVFVGPNQDPHVGRRSFEELLERAGYNSGEDDYPRITISEVEPC